ncbi:FG-GAP-like repeat-containing protein [Leptobacterium sp. I13]|uniref:FG-GAP-like repeat-containing protein n=1 Tax=Leptobacterium meishanense TaxID=3128904 RepID=UPI0030ECCE5B
MGKILLSARQPQKREQKNKNFYASIITAVMMLFVSIGAMSQTNFVSSNPTAGANGVVRTSNIVMTFDAAIAAAQVTSANIQVRGEQTGLVAGSFSGGDTPVITFDPTVDFKPGEVIQVTITTGLGIADSHSFTFRTASTLIGNVTGVNTNIVATDATDARDVFAADMDNDGDMDIISTSANTLTWYDNDGSENYTKRIIPSTNNPGGIFAADINGDGNLDIVLTSFSDDTLAWYESDGNITPAFTEHVIPGAGNGAISIYAIDVDGDGDMDILSGANIDNDFFWFENDGSETFTKHAISTNESGAFDIYAVDVDGDGDIDILTASSGNDTVAWFENDGSEVFTKRTITNTASAVRSVYAADVDSDGDMDVLSASSLDNTIAWYDNNGSEVFTKRIVSNTAPDARSVYAADVNGDGNMDVLSASATDNTIAVYENDGSEVFTKQVITNTATRAFSVYVADVGGDGDLDILSASRDNNTIAWYSLIDTPLSTTDESFKESIALYPNPSNGRTTISLSNNNAPINLVVSNLLGQRVFEKHYEATNTIVLNAAIPTGIYLVTLTSGNAKATLKMIVE